MSGLPPPLPSVVALSKLLDENPVEFDIAILRDCNNNDTSDDNNKEDEEEGQKDPFILQEGHLGLHAGDLAWLARDFRRTYRAYRPAFMEFIESEPNNSITTSNQKVWQGNELLPERILQATSCLLLVCPDNATAWADRKRALLCLQLTHSTRQLWTKELWFVNLVMTKHSKAPTAWFHRKYVFQKIVDETTSIDNLMDLVRNEIKVCIRVADRYPKNYYAWTHRIYIVQRLKGGLRQEPTTLTTNKKENDDNICQQLFISLLEEEWTFIETWMRTHVSDHSAAHYGGCVLRMLLQVKRNINKETIPQDASLVLPDSVTSCTAFALKALSTAKRATEAFPTHEVVWIFRRICSHAFLLHMFSTSNSQQREANREITLKFWNQEVQDSRLVADRPDRYPIKKDENNEVCLEAALTNTLQLSYRVWILKHLLIYLRDQPSIDTVQYFGVDASTMRMLLLKMLLLLQECEHIPHNLYRSNKS